MGSEVRLKMPPQRNRYQSNIDNQLFLKNAFKGTI